MRVGNSRVDPWTRARLPFVAWDADRDWSPGEGSGSVADTRDGIVSEIRISRKTDSGASIIVATTDSTEQVHALASAMPWSFTSLPDRQTISVPPLSDSTWKDSTITIRGASRPATVFTHDDLTIAVVTADVCLVVACYRCDIPNIVPATLGTIADII